MADVQVKNGMAYVMNTEGDFVTSEGMSYGMMITAQVKDAQLYRLQLATTSRSCAVSIKRRCCGMSC